MSGWREVTLGDITTKIGSGATPRGGKESYVVDGVSLIRSMNVLDGRFEMTGLARITDAQAQQLQNVEVFDGDVLVNITGASVARSCVAPRAVLPARVNQHVSIVRLKPAAAIPGFVNALLVSPEGKGRLLGLAAGGATRDALTKATLERFEIRLPPLAVQESVASILGAIDDLIENNRRRIEVLEQMAQTIYREWFVHFRYPGHEDATFVHSPLGPTPEGWETVPLGELVTTQYGYTESASTSPVGPRYLRGMDINKSSYVDWSTVPYCPIEERDRPRFRVARGDVFVIRMADPGKVGMCEIEIDAVFASYLVRLRPADGRIGAYTLFFMLRDEVYQGWVTGASTGATRKSVSAKVMTEPLVVVPPRDDQRRFEAQVVPLRSLLTELLQQNAGLAALRDLLLPKLVTGQIDVSHLDLDALVEATV